MVRTFLAIRDVPPGFQQPEEVLTLRISIPSAVVSDAGAGRAHCTNRSCASIEAVAGVESVGVTSSMSRWTATTTTIRSGSRTFPQRRRPDPAAAPPQVHRRRLLRDDGQPGRRRAAASPGTTSTTWSPVAMISDNLAREYWGEPAKAIGRRIRRTPKIAVDRNRRRRRQRAPGRRHAAGADDRLLADADRGDSGDQAPFVQRSLAYAIRSSRLQSPGFLAKCSRRCGASIPTCRSRACGRCSRSTTSRWRRRRSCW